MILARQELMDTLEPMLAVKLGKEVEVMNYVGNRVYFNVKSGDGKWVEGYVRVDHDTDLMIFIARPERHGGGYSYAGDINWCDILPEGIE